MNEHLSERFGRRPPKHSGEPPELNPKVLRYFKDAEKTVDGGAWLQCPEFPSCHEILDLNTTDSDNSSDVALATNRPRGSWESKEEYLSAHYELLREDAIRPLREAVRAVRITPQAKEDAFGNNIGIYDKVHICGVVCSTRGIAIRVTLSLSRVGKKVLWEQSKRLVSGSLVVLTPAEDEFRTKAIVATVAARPLDGLRANPPEIDLFVAQPGELEIDPAQEFWMVEHRGSMYEADRHTLLALQRMMREPFPLREHLVDVEVKVAAPKYAKASPEMDMTPVLKDNEHETYENVDVLSNWPTQPHSDLDASQMAALRRILTKRLAIIQGPPGTGKTHVSVQAIKIMLENRKEGDPPIIIACQTNHAVDQLLNHVAKFTIDFVRLGGRSKDKGVVKARTLHEVRKQTASNPLSGSQGPQARKKMRDMDKEFEILLSPLKDDKRPLDHHLLAKFNILTPEQVQCLEAEASKWVQHDLSNPNQSPFQVWLGRDLIPVPAKQQAENDNFDFEEADLEYEQLKDIEAENASKDDEDVDSLVGKTLPIADNFTCRPVRGVTEDRFKQMLKGKDVWRIPEAMRPAVYRYLQAQQKKLILSTFRQKAKRYDELATERRIGTMEEHERVLREQKIIGMTTTGLSKYRGLLASLEPKIFLIEEAAEVLEAPVAVACMPSLEHLILVGDHKQLRPHCKVKDLENHPYYLNVSLFERMVNNGVEYDTLTKQRRMIPEIRRILYPIYRNVITDHISVTEPANRPPVPGMGGVNTFFFSHGWEESRDDQNSAFNPLEANMIVGFFKYLVFNGMDAENITVLTFYNGQRKYLLRLLRNDLQLKGQHFKVVTVDSYQGEENEVVILSLVRSNSRHQIGFLENDNRVCVALSRAKRGFYLFGNGVTLYPEKKGRSPEFMRTYKTWIAVLKIFADRDVPAVDRLQVEPRNRVDEVFTVQCEAHNKQTKITCGEDWTKITGGCETKCEEELPCGHKCPLTCHPFAHDMVICRDKCGKKFPCCGRLCEEQCSHEKACVCTRCRRRLPPAEVMGMLGYNEPSNGRTLSQRSSSEQWKAFAKEEPERYAHGVASANASRRTGPEKQHQTTASSTVDVENAMQQLSRLEMVGAGAQTTPLRGPTLQQETADRRIDNDDVFAEFGKSAVNGSAGTDWAKKGSLLD